MGQPGVDITTISHQENDSRQQRIQQNQALIALLNSWEQEGETEQRETLQFLMHALDEDRLSSRKLFS